MKNDDRQDLMLENFYKVMRGEKEILTERDKIEFEASYFAMCILLPEESFVKVVDSLGGVEVVKSSYENKSFISRLFKVSYELVEIRINDLLSQQKCQNGILKKKIKSI